VLYVPWQEGGSAIGVETVDSFTVDGSGFVRNESKGWGAIASIEVNNVAISNTDFSANIAVSSCHAFRRLGRKNLIVALLDTDTALCYLIDFTFSVVVLLQEGGAGIYAMGGSLAITKSNFTSNVATSDCGGGVETEEMGSTSYDTVCFEMNSAPDGGAGCSYDDGKTVSFTDVVTVWTNTATNNELCSDFSFDGSCTAFAVGSCPL
jgi:hypothetical protein